MKDACTELFITTDDGTLGEKGFVTQVLERIMGQEKVDYAIAVGPMPMMRAVANMTKDKEILEEVSSHLHTMRDTWKEAMKLAAK